MVTFTILLLPITITTISIFSYPLQKIKSIVLYVIVIFYTLVLVMKPVCVLQE